MKPHIHMSIRCAGRFNFEMGSQANMEPRAGFELKVEKPLVESHAHCKNSHPSSTPVKRLSFRSHGGP